LRTLILTKAGTVLLKKKQRDRLGFTGRGPKGQAREERFRKSEEEGGFSPKEKGGALGKNPPLAPGVSGRFQGPNESYL